MLGTGSTPSYDEFNPNEIPYQAEVVNDMEFKFDYSLGLHEILLSGSVGSAKSILAAHQGIKDSLRYPNNRGIIARRSLPDLRDTIYTKLCEHLEGTDGLKEGRDYFLKDTTCNIRFKNGSEIIARSWADRKYKKLGSLEAGWAIVEELTENDDEDHKAIKYLRMRVGRLSHIPRFWIMYCTNPDSPAHFAYEYFDIGKRYAGLTKGLPLNRHVYFSKTKDNKFLPENYITQLETNMDVKLARRMIHGEWTEVDTERIYHAYGDHNYRDYSYEINPELPIAMCHDFNIGQGKPMSMCLAQYDDLKDEFHYFAEVIVEGADTEAIMSEMAGRGHFDHNVAEYHIYGDATGEAKSANSKKSNYDIIIEFIAKHRNIRGEKIWFEKKTAKSNPAIRERHIRVNAYCRNALGKTRLFVYKDAQTLHKGMRLTELKKGGQYIEDDSKPYQHVTTALGYHVHRIWKRKQNPSDVRMQKIR